MKKYLYSALALPLLFACSSDDLIEKEMISNDQFAGIEKVDATFYMDEERAGTRMDAGSWNPQNGDLWGFAWLGDGTTIDPSTDGKAYQNHNLIQTTDEGGTTFFKPQTSIYVGSYFIYRPYDFTTVSPQAINFNSLAEQTIAEGYASSTQAWKDLAKTAINIGDKWTVVTKTGTADASDPKKFWDKAGIEQNFKLYAAMFSNQTGLDMKYTKNDVTFDGTKAIAGATDIKFTPANGTKVGAADIYSGKVTLEDADNSFTYAPTVAPMVTAGNTDHVTGFWADKKDLTASGYKGFTFQKGAIALNAVTEKAKDGISTDGKTTGWIWFNSLPVENASGSTTSTVNTVLTTSYGVVTIPSTVGDCAYEFHDFGTATAHNYQWVKLAAATDEAKSPKEWDVTTKSTFVNQYGNHKGKFAITVDFSKGVMNGMHIINDTHLQKALKYYIASGKDETGAVLLLDKDADNEFKISKLSIALLQTINKTSNNVLVKACDADATHTPDRIVITQEGQTGDLAGKTEVPALNKVFAAATEVILAKNTNWTWTEGDAADGKIPGGKLTIDGNVKSITNEGTLTVNATNVQLSETDVKIFNAEGATMNITKVTTVKNTLHNYGTLNVGSAENTKAELRAYGPKWIVNNATSLTKHGVINNFGVVGVTAGTSGQFHNYGLIKMMNNDAITLLTSNEKGTTPFKNTFNSSTNKMGTVELPTGNPYAIVSVSNAAENGFIKYNWTAATYAHDPGNVKYNTIVVSGNIEFTGAAAATEIQFIEFDGTNRALVVNPAAASKLTKLKGIIVKDNSSIVIEKTNEIDCADGAFLGDGATVYKGGAFTVAGGAFASPTNTKMYLGEWSLDQIVEY